MNKRDVLLDAGKEAAGKDEIVAGELQKLRAHLLRPTGAARRFGRAVERAVAPSLRSSD